MNMFHHQLGMDPLYKIWNFSDANMILYVHHGSGNVVFQDKIYPMKNGALYFIGAGRIHYTMPEDTDRYDRSKLFFGDEMRKGILGLFPASSDFSHLFSGNSAIYAQIPPEERERVEEYFCSAAAHGAEHEMTVSAIIALMGFLKKYATESITAPTDPLSLALNYINAEYARVITLDDICKKTHISKYNFCRKFKKALGVTVMEYLLKTRIAAAKTLLSDGELSLGEIIDRCGFSSQSYFCQSFKLHVGVTPTAYRRAMLKRDQGETP